MDAVHRIDEMLEGFVALDINDDKYEGLQQDSHLHQISRFVLGKFNILRRVWFSSVESYLRKLYAAEKGHPSIRPHSFSRLEIAIWQISTMADGKFPGGWYDLPGPASLWPTEFNYDAAGWVVPSMESKYIELCRKALAILHGEREPTLKDVDLLYAYLSRF